MSNHINNLFISMRNVRAGMTAIVMLGALFWILWATNANRIEFKELTGQLLEVIAAGDKSSPAFYLGKVKLKDGKIVSITMSVRPPVPKVGDQIPIIFELYDDGTTLYGFNNTQWILDGGIPNFKE